jgi:predicted RNA-binding Zn-ribbon protein involved in translation (DUF1610 family)
MKRPIKVDIIEETRTYIVTKYICPSCGTHCQFNIADNVTRFRCIRCERELIVNNKENNA